SLFKQANAIGVGAGEGTLLKAEELRFEQALRERPAIDSEKRSLFPRTVGVNLLGHELFSRAALAIDQHGRLGAGHTGNGLVDRQHLGTAANQARCWLDGFKPNLELLILLNKPLLLQRALHNRFDFINVEGLADVVKGALADSFNCR